MLSKLGSAEASVPSLEEELSGCFSESEVSDRNVSSPKHSDSTLLLLVNETLDHYTQQDKSKYKKNNKESAMSKSVSLSSKPSLSRFFRIFIFYIIF